MVVIRFIVAVTTGAALTILAGFGLGKLIAVVEPPALPANAPLWQFGLFTLVEMAVGLAAAAALILVVSGGVAWATEWVKQEDKLIDK